MDIRLTTKSDAQKLANYYSTNMDHFRNWQPARETGYYSEQSVFNRLSDCEKQHAAGDAAHFIAISDKQVIAHCSLTNVIYGPFKACFMGFGVDKEHEGAGIMTKVCRVSVEYAFKTLELNRIMANHMPRNERSAALLTRLGFAREGLARNYLKINGKWEDHVLTSLLNPGIS